MDKHQNLPCTYTNMQSPHSSHEGEVARCQQHGPNQTQLLYPARKRARHIYLLDSYRHIYPLNCYNVTRCDISQDMRDKVTRKGNLE